MRKAMKLTQRETAHIETSPKRFEGEGGTIIDQEHIPTHPGVIAVGLESRTESGPLRQEIEALGLALVAASEDEPLSGLLRSRRGATVIVYSPKSADRAHQLLASLEEDGCGSAVIVLTDEPDFGQYYDLMGRGAADYLSVSDHPERIARAVQRAAKA